MPSCNWNLSPSIIFLKFINTMGGASRLFPLYCSVVFCYVIYAVSAHSPVGRPSVIFPTWDYYEHIEHQYSSISVATYFLCNFSRVYT